MPSPTFFIDSCLLWSSGLTTLAVCYLWCHIWKSLLCTSRLQHKQLSSASLAFLIIVFRRPTVHLDILPVKLCDIERLDCVKLLGVFIDSKLLFGEYVERLLGVCYQRLYLLSQLRKQGLFDECVAVVYDAIVLSKVLQCFVSVGWIYKPSV